MIEAQALHKLAAYCSKAERCELDIRKKMMLWEVPDEQQVRILSRLKQEKFLDDERYARAFVNDKSRFSKWGKVKIEFGLRKKKIAETLIRKIVTELPEDEFETVLTDLLRKKEKTVKTQNDYEKRTKLMRFAAGRGFSMEQIMHCMDKIVKSEDEYME